MRLSGSKCRDLVLHVAKFCGHPINLFLQGRFDLLEIVHLAIAIKFLFFRRFPGFVAGAFGSGQFFLQFKDFVLKCLFLL